MSETNIFELVKLINANGRNPDDVTKAIFTAGYRKPDRNAQEAGKLALDTIYWLNGLEVALCYWPETFDEVLECELSQVVFDAAFESHSIAKAVIAAGYTRVSNGGANG